jgi:hypothetical protein
VDDIIVYGENEKIHDQNLLNVLKRLYDYHVKINFNKSEIRKEELNVLGHKIKLDELTIDKSIINNPLKIPDNINKKGIQKIIGCLNWFRTFIPHFSEKIKPLTDMLRNTAKEKINKENKEKIESLIEEIKNASSLKIPNFNERFQLACDASDFSIGAVLYQTKSPIGYYSRKFNAS